MTSAPAPPVRAVEAWERQEQVVLHVVPYLSLAVATLLAALVSAGENPPRVAQTLALAGVTAAWMVWWVTLHPRWRGEPARMGIYYVGLLVLIAALVATSPLYGFFSFVGYLHAFLLRGRWRFAGVAITAFLTAAAQIGGFPPLTPSGVGVYLAVVAVNLALAATFSYFSWLVDAQNKQRKAIIAELGEANQRLSATLEENVGLHAQLVTQAREAGVLDERQRMAREIHDTLAQGLIGIVAQLEAAEQVRNDPAEWQRHLDTAARLARESLSEARRSVQAIQPEPLESARLPEAIADVAERWSAISGVPAAVTTTGTTRRLHPEIEVALLRTAQEALSNVAKHAAASRVGLTLSYMEGQVTLDVRDDGAGFDPELVRRDGRPVNGTAGGGFGLEAMRQRVLRLAGSLEIESEPGAGTAISASVPAVPAAGGGDD